MPRPQPRPMPLERAAILARLELGETLTQVCASEGMPTTACVWNWARKDGTFWAALACAIEAGRARRPPPGGFPPFDEAQAKRVLANLAAGMRVMAALKAAGGPSWRTFRHWRRTQGHFAEAVAERIVAVRRTRLRGRWRDYDLDVAVEILNRVAEGGVLRRVLASDRRFPCLSVMARWRAADPELEAAMGIAMEEGRRARGPRLWSEGLERRICHRVLAGASLRAVARDPAMPCGTTLRTWMRSRPGFARGVDLACEMRDQMIGEQALALAEGATNATAEAAGRKIGRLNQRVGRMRRGRGG